jgi:2,4-diketo-3-deoxy-L-fuconate hydrolase
VDWEVELAVVIGKEGGLRRSGGSARICGGLRFAQRLLRARFSTGARRTWVKGKSADTFSPLGPFLATCDEIPNTGDLAMWLKVNGVHRQRSSTHEMIFDVPTLVSYVSQFMTLLPGDVVSTGTPAGVGLGMRPPQYLKAGDVVELGIDKLGESQQKVVAWQPRTADLAHATR